MFNERQEESIKYNGECKNLLVLAGAGTGKTTTMIQRVVHLINKGVDANEILLLTFTNRAAREMKTRLKRELGTVADDIFAGTFHKLCLEIMTQMPKTFGLTSLNIIDQDEQSSLMARSRAKVTKKLDRDTAKEFPSKKMLLDLKSFSVNACVPYYDYLKDNDKFSFSRDTVELIVKSFDDYEKSKLKSGYLDFDDMLTIFNSVLKKNKDVRERIQNAFSYILVDEFQDTNILQYELLKNICSQETNLFCVGDDAQSIYGWRGARFETINRFDEHFENSKVIKLVENYRSSQEILDVSNWLLEKSDVNYNKKLIAAKGKTGLIPEFKTFYDPYNEAEFVANKIIDRYNTGYKYRDIAVIIPTAFSSREIEAELIRRKVPYVFIGGTSISKAAHVKDVLSLVRVIDNPKDELAWLRFLCLFPRIGEATASKLINELLKESDFDGMLSVIEDKFTSDSAIYKAMESGFSDLSKPDVIVRNCCSALVNVLKDRYDRWSNRSKDLKALMASSEKYFNLTEFLQDLVLEPMHNTEIEKDEVDDAVTIITVHSAKGTEYPITFVSAVNPGLYPNIRSLGDPASEEEQRRVLYVALTRAKEELVVTRTMSFKNTAMIDSLSAVGEAYYFNEVPAALFKNESQGANKSKKKGFFALSD